MSEVPASSHIADVHMRRRGFQASVGESGTPAALTITEMTSIAIVGFTFARAQAAPGINTVTIVRRYAVAVSAQGSLDIGAAETGTFSEHLELQFMVPAVLCGSLAAQTYP
jgi:hypothetical protein